MFSESTISITALFVSLLTAAFTGIQSYRQHLESRISILPRLDWRTYYNGNDGYAFQINLVNIGLGPAVVRDLSVAVDGETFGPLNGETCRRLDNLIADANGIDPADIDISKSRCWSMNPEDLLYMRAGEELVMYQLGPVQGGPPKPISEKTGLRIGLDAAQCDLNGEECSTL